MASGQRGFTLIEMIASVLILVVVLSALLGLAGHSRRLQQEAARNAGMALEARSLLDGAFAGMPPRPGVVQGRLADGCRWSLRTVQVPPPVPAAGIRLYRLDLELRRGTALHSHLERFSTFRAARPPGGGS